MSLPSHLVCSEEEISLIRLTADDVDWVIQNTDAELLENVFSSSKGLLLSEFYKTQFSWTFVYLIVNGTNDTFSRSGSKGSLHSFRQLTEREPNVLP